MAKFKPGDRVYATDAGLAELRKIMRKYGHDPAPNHHGTVEKVDDGYVIIAFDDEDGPGQGSAAPYPLDEVRHLPEAVGTTLVVPDSPKALRETLCIAQSRIGNSGIDRHRAKADIARLQRLIDECDRHRPIGPDGKHGDLHTPTCGCEDR